MDDPGLSLEDMIGEFVAGLVFSTNNAMQYNPDEDNEELRALCEQGNIADIALSELFRLATAEGFNFTEIAKRKGLERLRKIVYDPPDNFEETVNVIIERYVIYLKQQMN